MVKLRISVTCLGNQIPELGLTVKTNSTEYTVVGKHAEIYCWNRSCEGRHIHIHRSCLGATITKDDTSLVEIKNRIGDEKQATRRYGKVQNMRKRERSIEMR